MKIVWPSPGPWDFPTEPTAANNQSVDISIENADKSGDALSIDDIQLFQMGFPSTMTLTFQDDDDFIDRLFLQVDPITLNKNIAPSNQNDWLSDEVRTQEYTKR